METATTSFIVLKELAGNPPPQFNAIQQLLLPHTETLVIFWRSIWVFTAFMLLYVLWHEYKKHRRPRA